MEMGLSLRIMFLLPQKEYFNLQREKVMEYAMSPRVSTVVENGKQTKHYCYCGTSACIAVSADIVVQYQVRDIQLVLICIHTARPN